MSRRYAPGTWFGAVSAQGVAVLPADIELDLVEGVWERLGRGKGLGGVLEALTGAFGTSLSAIPSFAVVLATAEQARLAVRGPLTVSVRVRAGDPVVVSGLGVTTWSERVIDDPLEIELLVDAAPPVERWFPIADGVALVSGIRLPLAPAPATGEIPVSGSTRVPRAVASPAPPELPVAAQAAAPVQAPDDRAADTRQDVAYDTAGETADETWMPPVETVAAEIISSLPGAETPATRPPAEIDEYDHLWGATVVKPVSEAAVRPEPEPDSDTASGPVDSPRPASPAEERAPGDHDGETISFAQAQALRGAAPATPAVPPLERPVRPHGRIVLSTGREVELDRSVVIGRRPRAVRVTGGVLPHLIAVESPQQDISRSHIEIRTEGDAVLVVDLDTTNGTVLIREGAPPVRLHPDEPTIVIDGDVVDLGDEVTVTFRGDRMSARRPPSTPPELPGFTYEALLGSGGFADVFLYQQLMPQRRVAVKVLLTERMTRGSADAFDAEANIMARLSTHPAIVTIYQAGVSSDGRPYLVMEYCPKPNLQVRYRREPFSVAESLRVGVQVAAAVETAHRAGILHRDIKPANILVTEYNRPALTDFGIAVATGADGESAGMSIPWSPPEAFADVNNAGPASDVWALGATVYTLLAGRSPFEAPGGRNGSADLIQRIESAPLAPLARPDAPESLQRLLERSMAKAPGSRYASALDFARALQRVQIELSMSATPIDVLDDNVDAVAPEDEDGALTRIRNVVSIDPTRPAAPSLPTYAAPVTDTTQQAAGATVARFAPDAGFVDAVPTGVTSAGPLEPAPVPSSADATVRRPSSIEAQRPSPPPPAPASPAPMDSAATPAPAAPRRGRLGLIIGIAAAVVVLGGVGIAWAVASGTVPDPAGQTSAPPEEADPIDVLPGSVPVVTDLTGTRQGDQVVFTWTNPDPADGDTYIWGVQRLGEAPSLQSTDSTTVTVPAEASGSTCIEVTLRRADGTASDPDRPAQACTP